MKVCLGQSSLQCVVYTAQLAVFNMQSAVTIFVHIVFVLFIVCFIAL